MRKLIERMLARFGFVVLKTEPRVTPEPTLAEACFQFGAREAQIHARYHAELQTAYLAGHAQGELMGRTELHREIAAQYGIDGGEHNMTREDVMRIGTRQLH